MPPQVVQLRYQSYESMRKERLRLVREAYREICAPKEDKHSSDAQQKMSLAEEEAKLMEEVKKTMEVQKRKQKEEVEMMYVFLCI